MSDASSSVPVRAPPEAKRPADTQLVYRENIELFKLEQALPYAETPERQYNILSLIITRELAAALTIVPPPTSSPKYRDWAQDMRDLRVVESKFNERKIPVTSFPNVVPHLYRGVVEYTVRIDQDTPVSTVLEGQLASFIEVMMRHRLQNAFQEAIRPLWTWYNLIRQKLAKWNVWNFDTEALAGLASYTNADMAREIKQAQQLMELPNTGVVDVEEVIDGDVEDPDDYDDRVDSDTGDPTNAEYD